MNTLAATLSDGVTIARRNIIKIRRVPQTLVAVLVSPLLMVVMFNYVFGSSIALGTTLRHRPVLTIFGQYNDPFRFQARWRELFPHTRQVVVARGNHFPMNDDPHGVAAAIRSWWQEGADATAR